MKRGNFEIRVELFANNIKQWELAEKLGIGETKLSKMLRNELPEEKKTEMLEIIKNMRANK